MRLVWQAWSRFWLLAIAGAMACLQDPGRAAGRRRSVNLDAPAPKTADGTPDLSGL